MSEEWRPVVGVDGYEVSNLGNLRSYRVVIMNGYRTARAGRRTEPQAINGTVNAEGYIVWGAYDFEKGKTVQYKAHHTVLEAFVGPRPEGAVTRHLNGNRSDNRLENIAWGTNLENRQDRILHGNHNDGPKSPTAKLTWEQVREIRASELTPLELAVKYDVTRDNIYFILRRATWKNDPTTTTNTEGEPE